jgi:hypothetical protein
MNKVVSFSLWGNSDVYVNGALDAVNQVQEQYPGWKCRFYLGSDVSRNTRHILKDKGAEILDGPNWGPWAGMYWRFLAAADPDVDIMLSRDVDTQILPRETAAVREWLDSGSPLHIIRDHPKHEMPIMGGMWGCRAEYFREIKSLILAWNRFSAYGCDQEFLARVLYPSFRDRAWIHSECVVFPHERVHPIPIVRTGEEVIGMAIRDDKIIDLQTRYLREWLDAGKPILKRPHPWSLPGKMRKLTRGLWPGQSL